MYLFSFLLDKFVFYISIKLKNKYTYRYLMNNILLYRCLSKNIFYYIDIYLEKCILFYIIKQLHDLFIYLFI